MLQLAIALVLMPDLPAEFCWPRPTPEITKLVATLGDDDFETREKAQKKLVDCGWSAMLAILHGQKDKDAEIRHRCKLIYDNYFSVWSTDTKKPVSIFQLNYSQEFKSIKIIDRQEAMKYYETAWLYYGHNLDDGIWNDDGIGTDAMTRYVVALLKKGIDRESVRSLIIETQQRKIDFPMQAAEP